MHEQDVAAKVAERPVMELDLGSSVSQIRRNTSALLDPSRGGRARSMHRALFCNFRPRGRSIVLEPIFTFRPAARFRVWSRSAPCTSEARAA